MGEYGVDYGCGDGGCVFKHRPKHFGGMCTNGGCRCLAYDYLRDVDRKHRAMRGVQAMRDYIKELRAVLDAQAVAEKGK